MTRRAASEPVAWCRNSVFGQLPCRRFGCCLSDYFISPHSIFALAQTTEYQPQANMLMKLQFWERCLESILAFFHDIQWAKIIFELLYTVVVSSTKRSHLKLNLVAVLDFSITSHELHQHIEVASHQLNVAVEILIFLFYVQSRAWEKKFEDEHLSSV